jgi:hypothetical protein
MCLQNASINMVLTKNLITNYRIKENHSTKKIETALHWPISLAVY